LIGALPAHGQPSIAEEAEVIRLKTRGEIEQAYLLLQRRSPVKVVAVLFTGGFGLLKFRGSGAGIAWERQGNSFLVINKDRFVDDATAVAVVDAPSDQQEFGYTPKVRKSPEHATDVRGVVNDLKDRFPGARVFLLGTSQGSTSAAHAGVALGREIAGVILSASVFAAAPASWRLLHDPNLSDFDFARIQAPLLIVHHVDDRCVATPYSAAEKLAGRHPLIVVSGGEPVRDNGCGPLGPHGFLGREEAVAAEIMNWMHGRPYRKAIE
jgi:pimeloyl-ACP methyl ester carboxylesterase